MKNLSKNVCILLFLLLVNQSCTTESAEEFKSYDLKGKNSQAGIIDIPDENFKNVLLNTYCVDTNGDGFGDRDADLNDDGEIQKKEANSIERLLLQFIYETPIKFADLTGIENFTNLKFLKISGPGGYFYEEEVLNTEILSYDFSGLRKLEYLQINGLATEYYDNINLSGLNKLREIDLSINRPMDFYTDKDPFITVNFEGCSSLKNLNMSNSFLNIDFCQISSLERLNMYYLEGGEPNVFDFQCLTILKWLDISENRINKLILKNSSVLETLIAKDVGSEDEYINYPFPNYLCIDDIPQEWEQVQTLIGPDNIVSTECTF